jgi:hypothetical protein
MAEVCLAAPVLILLWVGVDYFRVGYARRLQTLSDAHAAAWQSAYSNDGSCFKAGGGPWQGFTGGTNTITDGNGNPVDPGPRFSGSSSMFMYGTTRASADASVSNAYWSAKMTSQTFITCNEVVPDANGDQNVITPLWDVVKSFFSF